MSRLQKYFTFFLFFPIVFFLDFNPIASFSGEDQVAIYHFPVEDICGSYFEDICDESTAEDRIINTGSRLESKVLGLVEIDATIEKEIGDKFHKEATFNFVEDQRLRKLKTLLDKLKPFSKKQKIDYEIFLVEDFEVNAWTVPGGKIYFSTAAFDFAESDDELISIIGHEVGHHECLHTHQQLKRKAAANMPFSWLGVEIDTDILAGLYSKLTAAFNQHQEIEADRTGMVLTNQAGYNPKLGLEFWNRLAETEKESRFQKFFRSHPYSKLRYDCGLGFLAKYKVD